MRTRPSARRSQRASGCRSGRSGSTSRRSRAGKRSVEDAARSARYAFFERVAAALPRGRDRRGAYEGEIGRKRSCCGCCAGAGTRGSRRSSRARDAWCARCSTSNAPRSAVSCRPRETFREDATNADVSIPRNRVRHELIPYLESHFFAGVTGVLARDAALARQDEEFLHDQAIKLAAGSCLTSVAAVTLVRTGSGGAPRALSSRVAQAALQRLAGPKSINFDHVSAACAGVGRGRGGAVSLPGQYAVRSGKRSCCGPAGAAPRCPRTLCVFVVYPWRGRGSDRGIAVRAELSGPAAGASVLDYEVGRPGDRGSGSRRTRSASPGRQESPAGRPVPAAPGETPGGRKLQDFLVDRKVARDERDALPLVVDGRDRIVWVVGQSVAEDFRVTDPSQGVLLLKVRRI
jgi:tRNA(Ile)-lysidine synthase